MRIAGAIHNTFWDIPYDYEQLLGVISPGARGIAPERAIRIINAYDLAFFEKHLKGMSEPLLEGLPPYPEVTFTKK